MTIGIIIKLLGNFLPAAFGIYALRNWKKANWSRTQIKEKMGFSPFSAYQLFIGIALGAAAFSSIFYIYKSIGLLSINDFSWTNGNLITTVLMFTAGAIGEELIFRSFFFNGLKEFTKSIPFILIISSLFFSLVHWFNEGSTVLSSFSAFMGGIMYGYAFIRTEKLWLPIGLHFSWNFFQSFVFGFPVSGFVKEGLFNTAVSGSEFWTGGSYGPEGGMIGILARIAVILLIWLLIKEKPAGNHGLKA